MWQNREMGDAWSPYPVGSDSGNVHRILMEAWVNTLIYWHVGNIRSFHSMCLKACSCVTWQLQTSSGPRHRNTMWAVRRWKEKRGQTSLVRQAIQQGSIWTSLCVLLIVRNVFYTWSGVLVLEYGTEARLVFNVVLGPYVSGRCAKNGPSMHLSQMHAWTVFFLHLFYCLSVLWAEQRMHHWWGSRKYSQPRTTLLRGLYTTPSDATTKSKFIHISSQHTVCILSRESLVIKSNAILELHVFKMRS